MVSDARFGVELYGHPDGSVVVAGVPMAVVGHVWSPDAARIVEAPDGSTAVVDPGGSNPQPLNGSLTQTQAFLEAFDAFYRTGRPGAAAPMTVEQARARLAAVHRGEVAGELPPVEPLPAAVRLATLRATLAAQDARALAPGGWWSRILTRPEFSG